MILLQICAVGEARVDVQAQLQLRNIESTPVKVERSTRVNSSRGVPAPTDSKLAEIPVPR